MTHKERMRAVLGKKSLPDKVPHGDIMIWPEIIDSLLGGVTFPERVNFLFYWMSERMDDHFFERDRSVRELLGFDYTHIFPSESWVEVGTLQDGSSILKDPYGVEHTVTADSVSMHRSPVQDIAKLDEYQLPTLEAFSFENLERWLSSSDLFTFLQIDSGIFKLYNILGFESCMMAAVEHPKRLHALMERLAEFQIELAREAIRKGADCIWLSDDHSGLDAPFLSPQMLWDLDFQYQKRVVDEVYALEIPCVMHSCGNLNKTVDLMIATGIDGIMGFQPTAHNDIEQYKQEYGNDIAFIGNICVTELMPRATPWQIDQEVKRLIHTIGRDGGFILSTCNALLHDEPIENVFTLHLAAEKYGTYPL